MGGRIVFCRLRDPYAEFSNFYPAPLIVNGLYWDTSEALYQASKFNDKNKRELVRLASTPKKAAELGRSLSGITNDWDERKYYVMKQIVRIKLQQHPRILELLLNTGNDEIIEYSKKDYYWGSGPDYSGQNKLGQILMELRDEFRTKKEI